MSSHSHTLVPSAFREGCATPLQVKSLLSLTRYPGGGGLGQTNDEGESIGLFGGGRGELLGGRREFEVDGLKRPIPGGDEISKYGEAEPGLRVAEFELGVERGVWRDVGDQDPLMTLVGVAGLRRRRSRIRYGLPVQIVLISMELQGRGNCDEIAPRIDDVEWA